MAKYDLAGKTYFEMQVAEMESFSTERLVDEVMEWVKLANECDLSTDSGRKEFFSVYNEGSLAHYHAIRIAILESRGIFFER